MSTSAISSRDSLRCQTMVAMLAGLVWLLPQATCTGQGIAEAGSPLYAIAVRESLRGLSQRGEEHATPAGQVCPYCGKIHPPAARTNGTPSQVAAPASAQSTVSVAGQPCPVCGKIHPIAASGVAQSNRTTTNAVSMTLAVPGLGSYYYCTNCKAYHRRPAVAAPLATLASPNAAAPAQVGSRSTGALSSGHEPGHQTQSNSVVSHPVDAGSEGAPRRNP